VQPLKFRLELIANFNGPNHINSMPYIAYAVKCITDVGQWRPCTSAGFWPHGDRMGNLDSVINLASDPMHTVLDLDLDFFGWPTLHDREHEERPIDDDFKHLADETDVRNFLERQCHLSTAAKLPGRQFVEHVDAFVTWREWIQLGKLSAPFAVVHIDGHADLGAGLGTYLVKRYIETKLLALPLEQRAYPWFDEREGVNSADYLVAAVANRWISRLT
jgi:hypothetical protein